MDDRIVVLAGDISPVDILTHIPLLAEEAQCPYVVRLLLSLCILSFRIDNGVNVVGYIKRSARTRFINEATDFMRHDS